MTSAMKARLLRRVLRLIRFQIPTNVWKVWSETVLQLMVHMISFLIRLKDKKTLYIKVQII